MSFFGDIALLWRAWRVGWYLSPFTRPSDYPEPSPVLVPEPVPLLTPPEPPPVAVSVEPAPEPEELCPLPPVASVAELKRDLLDGLVDYQVYIKRLAKQDPSTYRTYRRVGAYLMPRTFEADRRNLEPGVVSRLPTFGAVCFCGHDRKKPNWVPMRFAWMTKLSRPGLGVERRAGGVVYRCRMYFDTKHKDIWQKDTGGQREIVVHVADDGAVTPLRELHMQPQVIRHKHGAKKGTATTVHHQKWTLSRTDIDHPGMTDAEHIRELFTEIMNFWAQAATQSMIRVTASKDGVVMPFIVDPTKTSTFFSDRSTTVDEHGKKQRIFHVVRTHVRSSGVPVRLHFRGLRNFEWNGYKINIVVPGLDRVDIADLTISAAELDFPGALPPGKMFVGEMADRVAEIINTPSA